MTMKLNLVIVAMDLLSLLVYPMLFLYGKLRQFAKSRQTVTLINVIALSSALSDG